MSESMEDRRKNIMLAIAHSAIEDIEQLRNDERFEKRRIEQLTQMIQAADLKGDDELSMALGKTRAESRLKLNRLKCRIEINRQLSNAFDVFNWQNALNELDIPDRVGYSNKDRKLAEVESVMKNRLGYIRREAILLASIDKYKAEITKLKMTGGHKKEIAKYEKSIENVERGLMAIRIMLDINNKLDRVLELDEEIKNGEHCAPLPRSSANFAD